MNQTLAAIHCSLLVVRMNSVYSSFNRTESRKTLAIWLTLQGHSFMTAQTYLKLVSRGIQGVNNSKFLYVIRGEQSVVHTTWKPAKFVQTVSHWGYITNTKVYFLLYVAQQGWSIYSPSFTEREGSLRLHNSQPLVPTLGQMDTVHTHPHTTSVKSIWIWMLTLSSHLRLN
jgi:hypothetical protein